jgi:hypothetical protein
MRARLVWATLALVAVSVVGFLLLRPRQPKPIARASLELAAAVKRAPGAARMPVEGLAEPSGAGILQPAATATVIDMKANPFGPPRYAPRPRDEWQGMLINVNITPPCNASAECGLARACIDEKCMPCERDEHCADGEACVLQHCIAMELVECRRTAECGKGSKCILSGYSRDPRGNEGTRSYCNSNFSGAASMVPPEPLPRRETLLPVASDKLIEAARAAK